MVAYLDRSGFVPVSVPNVYAGRVSGIGDIASGRATFTLSFIANNDENFYGCEIDSTGLFPETNFDPVRLVVEGAYAKYYSLTHSERQEPLDGRMFVLSMNAFIFISLFSFMQGKTKKE